ncbi:uncharacterized protein LOC118740378 isoform X2 [Rhagoletis pomonella]|uniref:uncharacterized protein LOC118740378 isoform X2 n=1 Tax=Rhagoletis pomonella TaxID=28610 RepID=UPI00177EC286|nr:uncharacterized protein LOC118740378 isoform X2 [Rhagoletis pomonella]
MSTPEKKGTNFTEKLTPVRLVLDSPRLKSASEDANFTACKARLKAIVSLLQDNYSKWQLAQKRGTTICTSIEAIKTRALETKESCNQIIGEHRDTIYPNGLKPYAKKLRLIASIFEDITKSTEDSLRQLISLSRFPGSKDKVFYRSWHLSQYINFVEQLHGRYRKETEVKQYVARELPHCMSRADLICCTTAWEYPQYVDVWTSLTLAFLREESK